MALIDLTCSNSHPQGAGGNLELPTLQTTASRASSVDGKHKETQREATFMDPSADRAQHFLLIMALFILLHIRNNCSKRANQLSRQVLCLLLSLLLSTKVCSSGPVFVHPFFQKCPSFMSSRVEKLRKLVHKKCI